MKALLLAVGSTLGCSHFCAAETSTPADEPTHTVVVELDNVCGRDCVALLEKALAKIDGVKTAEMYGDKFHFKLEVLETRAVLPAAILKVTDKIRQDSKGEEDFPLLSVEA